MAEEEGRGEGFLSRWSRLKQGRREAGEAEARPVPPATAPGAAAIPATAESLPAPPPGPGPQPAPAPVAEAGPPAEPEPEIDLASLPRLEDLTASSDLSVFLKKGVPASLRHAALRRVWSLDANIRDFIGPADYAWDWNVPGGAPGYVETIAHGPDVEALADRILGIGRAPAREAEKAEEGSTMAQPAEVAAADGEASPEAHPEAQPEAPREAGSPETDGTGPRPASSSLPGTSRADAASPPATALPDGAHPEPAPPRMRHGGAVPA
jgi:hypothetical protein